MALSVTPAELQSVVSALKDLTDALSADLTNLPADQTVVLDSLKLAAMFDPGLAPAVVLEPLAYAILVWVGANNEAGTPGSETPMHGSGERGNVGSGGGRI